MAIAKKSAVSKTTKKTTVKRAPAKSTSTTKVKRVTRPAHKEVRSFRASASSEPFFTFRLSRQTLYWLVLAAIVLSLGIWVTDINIKVQRIYDQIDQTNQQISNLPEPSTIKQK